MPKFKSITDHPLMLQLTDKQRSFVEHYVATQDAVASAKTAGYNCPDELHYFMMARKNFKHPAIKALLGYALNYEHTAGVITKHDLEVMVSDGARRTKNPATKYKYCALLAALRGWVGKEQTSIPDMVREMERQRKKKKE